MFYQSLLLVFLLTLSSQVPAAMRSRWSFGAMYFVWVFLWGITLFHWHLFVSHPPAVFTAFLFLFLAISLARAINLRSRWYALWSVGCVVLAYTISILQFVPVFHEHQRVLAQNPPIDLKPRLAYEHPKLTGVKLDQHEKSTDVAVAKTEIESPRFDPQVLQDQAKEFDTFIGYHKNRRTTAFAALSKVHAGFVKDFIEQPAALGVGRLPAMRSLRESDFETVDRFYEVKPDILIDQPAGPVSEAEAASKNAENRENAGDAPPIARNEPEPAVEPVLSRESLQEYHLESVVGFVSPESLGSVNEGLEARGFISHAFQRLPGPRDFGGKPKEWEMARLELVSLLKHQPPAVYVSDHLPAMDELRDAPTRPTTKFEEDAISRLRAGEELVVETTGQTGRMVGSIRAIAECRKCHQVPLGGLLGAFSYRLTLGKIQKPQLPKAIKGEALLKGTKVPSVASVGR